MFNAFSQIGFTDVRRGFEDDVPCILSYRLQHGKINLPLSRRQMIVTTLRIIDMQSNRIEG